MFAFLPLLLALLILQGSGRGDFDGADALALLASLGAWILIVLGSGWVLARIGRGERVGRYEMIGFASLLALHGWWCFRLDWPPIGGAIVGLAPMVVGIVVLWWSLGYVASRRAGHGPGPLSFLWLRLKLGLLPILVLVGLVEAGGWAVQGLVATGWLPGWLVAVLVFGGGFAVPLLVLLILPLVLVRMWGARPLPAGETRDLLERGCRRAGVRVRSILHWPTGKGRFVNAAAMGMIARFRYVLFTDFLLERLGRGEIQGVLGHELGHIRHRHLWIYLLFILTAGIWSTLLLPSIDLALAGLPAVGDLDLRLRQTLALVLLWGAIIWFGFGYLSRACERQADLAGVELCDDPVDMQDALRHVAELAGQDPEAPSWRHHSIAERVRFLERARLDPGIAPAHHRKVMRLHVAIWVLLGLAILFTFFQPPRRVDFAEMVREDRDLQDALIAAVEEDDGSDLHKWITTQNDHGRRLYAAGALQVFEYPQLERDEAVAARYLPYVRPFSKIPTGHARLDAQLDNIVAYLLATGTRSPSAEDLATMKELLPRLREQMEERPSSAVWDTIGCVHFRFGEYAEAEAAFEKALELLEKEDDRFDEKELGKEWRSAIRRLYRLRLEAARTAEGEDPFLPLTPDADPPPEKSEDAPE